MPIAFNTSPTQLFEVNGKIVVADDYGIELPEGDYETIAGLILDRLERIPHQGQVINIPPYKIQILQATAKQIIKVKIHKTSKIEV